MSADNWAICPKCTKSAEAKAEKMGAAVEKAYGVVSPAAYKELVEQLAKFKGTPEEEYRTLREDYELGVYEGKFFVSYCGHCSECHWEHTFKHEEVLPAA